MAVGTITPDPQTKIIKVADSRRPQEPSTSNPVATPPQPSTDARIRLGALDTSIYTLKGKLPVEDSILSVLAETNGIIFPYTPTVSYSQAVSYMDLQLVHSNTDYPAYTRTPSVGITINGKFTVQSQEEGRYALACLHFLRTVSKMRFGEQDIYAGLPPPILLLSGYGRMMFGTTDKGLRVILKNHSWSFDETMDTIMVLASASDKTVLARLPPMFSISCELMVVQTPARMRTVFYFDDFASGALMKQKEGWI